MRLERDFRFFLVLPNSCGLVGSLALAARFEMTCRRSVIGEFSWAGESMGDTEGAERIAGTSELARLSWRLDESFAFGGWPFVMPGVAGVAPFSFVTSPLS